MANPGGRRQKVKLPPRGWRVEVRVPFGIEDVRVVDLGGRLLPSHFLLIVQPPDLGGEAVAVQYEVSNGAVAASGLGGGAANGRGGGADIFRAADVLREGMSTDEWAQYAVSQIATQLLIDQFARQDDPEALARAFEMPLDKARRTIELVKESGKKGYLGFVGQEADAAANSPEWAAARAVAQARYEATGSRSLFEEVPVRRAPRRNSITREHLREVAGVYRRAIEQHLPPTKAVADHFSASHSTSARWVGMARKEGLLGPAERGRSGEREDAPPKR